MTLFIYLYVLHCKQATGDSVVTVGYVMKHSHEEDFAKLSPIWINVGIFNGEKQQEIKLCDMIPYTCIKLAQNCKCP